MNLKIVFSFSLLAFASQSRASDFSFSCFNDEYHVDGTIASSSESGEATVTELNFKYLPTNKTLPVAGARASENTKGRTISFYPKGFGPMVLEILDNLDNAYSRARGHLTVPSPDMPDAQPVELECAGESLN